jgi:hypothetical protein
MPNYGLAAEILTEVVRLIIDVKEAASPFRSLCAIGSFENFSDEPRVPKRV